MLEVVELELTGAEVKRIKRNVPKKVDVNVNIDKITRKAPNAVVLDFTYAVDYKPQVAKLQICGVAYCRDTPTNIKRLFAEYKKRKMVPLELGAGAVNMINANAGLNSVFLVRPFNLLPSFMPPMIALERGGPAARTPARKAKK